MSRARGLLIALGAVLASLALTGCVETRLTAQATIGDPANAYSHLKKMPIVEIPATGSDGGPLVVLYSGDDGWDVFDRLVTAHMAARGAPVAGVSSLVYFLKGRSPKGAAADLSALIAHYSRVWDRHEVILVGYSYGGDDMPLIAQALPKSVLAHVRRVVLISPAARGDLIFRGASWFDLATADAKPLAPALKKLAGIPILCIHSDPDPRQACDKLSVPGMKRAEAPGGHHYVGHEVEVADLILDGGPPRQ